MKRWKKRNRSEGEKKIEEIGTMERKRGKRERECV